jgi:hypothetical protein
VEKFFLTPMPNGKHNLLSPSAAVWSTEEEEEEEEEAVRDRATPAWNLIIAA